MSAPEGENQEPTIDDLSDMIRENALMGTIQIGDNTVSFSSFKAPPRRWRVRYLSEALSDEVIERDHARPVDGMVVFSNGPEYSIPTDVHMIPIRRISEIVEITE